MNTPRPGPYSAGEVGRVVAEPARLVLWWCEKHQERTAGARHTVHYATDDGCCGSWTCRKARRYVLAPLLWPRRRSK